ncbi:MAG: YicC family protein [Candidatus Omnitrophica bacterium]|nr:YicC family protein [Candidatus Omnitrophota bacterium]
MTGFGHAEIESSHGPIRVELKTVNHKFLEISSRLPGHLAEFEDVARKIVSQEIRRGKVNLFIACPDPATFSARLVLNEALAKEVYGKIRRLERVLKHKAAGNGVVEKVLAYPDVLRKDTSFERRGVFSSELTRTIQIALVKLDQSRVQEGRALAKDLLGRVSEIKKSLAAVERRLPVLGKEYRRALLARMKDYLKDGEIDKERLTVEVAQYLKSGDISEEVTRLKSHLHAMAKTLAEKGEIGRKVDFIAQEMTRETNTMGAKSSDAAIAEQVILMKSAIEKIREQAQNVE